MNDEATDPERAAERMRKLPLMTRNRLIRESGDRVADARERFANATRRFYPAILPE